MKPMRSSGVLYAVMTALTPGMASAAEVSMETIRALARSEYLMRPQSMPGSSRSWMYCACAVTLEPASALGISLPTTASSCRARERVRRGHAATPRRRRWRPHRRPQHSRAWLPRSPASRPPPKGRRRRSGCSPCNDRCCRRWPRGPRPRWGRARRSSSALADISMPGVQKPHCTAALSMKAALQRVQSAVGAGQALDRLDLKAVGLHRQEQAGVDRDARPR